MKSIIVVALALVAMSAAAPAEPPIEIVSSEFQTNPDGSYTFAYVSADGSRREETGVLKEALDEENKLQKFIAVSGAYTRLDVDGIPETVNYFADETGYHAEGETIPKVAY